MAGDILSPQGFESAEPLEDSDVQEVYQPTSGGVRRNKQTTLGALREFFKKLTTFTPNNIVESDGVGNLRTTSISTTALSNSILQTSQNTNNLSANINQGVKTTDEPVFANATIATKNVGANLDTLNGRVNQGVKTTDSPTFANATIDAKDVGANLDTLNSDVSTLNSRVNQGVKTTDSPTFAGGDFSNDITVATDMTVGRGGGSVSDNTAVGKEALRANTTGGTNTAVGDEALRNNTTGSNNTAVGKQTLFSNTSEGANTALGYRALTSLASFVNCTGLGYSTSVTGSNQVQLGNSFTTTYAYGAVQNRSDIRDKADINDSKLGLAFIEKLRPVSFKWDMRDYYLDKDNTDIDKVVPDGSKKRNREHYGFIAQEVKAVIEQSGVDFGGFQDHSINGGKDVMSLGYEEFIAPMVKAIQELSAEIEKLKLSIKR